MSSLVLLDAGPLGMATNPNTRPEHERCAFWLRALPSYGYTPVLPEIADYEVRRELIRANKTSGLRRLDVLKSRARYLPLTTEVLTGQTVIVATANLRHLSHLVDARLWTDIR